MTQNSWPRIRTRTETVKGQKYTYWVVDCGNIEGTRKRHSYRSLKEAEKKAEEIRREQPDIVGLQTFCTTIRKCVTICERARELVPGVGLDLKAVHLG